MLGESETASQVLRRGIIDDVNEASLAGACHPILSSQSEEQSYVLVGGGGGLIGQKAAIF